jgi:hypothetical protein
MVRLTCDPKVLHTASQSARSQLGEVTHGVDRVDKYGGSNLVAVWNGIKDVSSQARFRRPHECSRYLCRTRPTSHARRIKT